jgi:hypothetical protein
MVGHRDLSGYVEFHRRVPVGGPLGGLPGPGPRLAGQVGEGDGTSGAGCLVALFPQMLVTGAGHAQQDDICRHVYLTVGDQDRGDISLGYDRNRNSGSG